jgi:sorbitol-specific phosphotransferase system component IIC
MKSKKTPKKIIASVKEEKIQITRRDAVKKVSRYAAFTALGTMLLLSPKASQATSLPEQPGWGSS